MLEIFVFPDMNNLVQGPYLSVPEGRQGRNFHTLRQRFAKILLGLCHCTGFQRIGAKFIDTHRAFLSLANLRPPRRFSTEPELPSAVLYAPRGRESKDMLPCSSSQFGDRLVSSLGGGPWGCLRRAGPA